jgi:hypothetical protein
LATKRFDPSRTLAFLHIPKTSGVAITEGLKNSALFATQHWGFDRAILGGFDQFHTFAPEFRAILEATPASDVALVAGHYSFDTLKRAHPSAQFVTFLREPVARLISHWTYWRGMGEDDLAWLGDFKSRQMLAREPLCRIVSDPRVACQFDNVATRMVLWPDVLIPGDGFIAPADDEELVTKALNVLSRFDYVDVVESPNMRDDFARWLGFHFDHGRFNETGVMSPERGTSLADELTADVCALIEARSRLDRRLWKEVCKSRNPCGDPAVIGMASMASTIARHSLLLR